MKHEWFGFISAGLALLVAVLFLFVPMLLVNFYSTWLFLGASSHSTGAVVGMGVILRATARRLIRTGTRNVMQTTVSTFSRTTARAITRRIVRVAVKSLTLVTKRFVFTQTTQITEETQVQAEENPPLQETVEVPTRSQNPLVAVVLGFVALFFSMWAILYFLSWRDIPVYWYQQQIGAVFATNPFAPLNFAPLLDPEPMESEVHAIVQKMPLYVAALLAALPMLVYSGLIGIAARLFQVKPSFQTSFDGIMLQAYFTGGMSFLPLTTDVEYRGTTESAARVAATSLGGMFVIHLLLLFLSYQVDSHVLRYTSTMFLLYAFVYSFPIRPLDGQYLWVKSRWLWFLFWLPILISFILTIPEGLNAIL